MDTVEDFYLTRAGDKDVMLRDKRARLEKLFGAALGTDDRTFRLSASPASACQLLTSGARMPARLVSGR